MKIPAKLPQFQTSPSLLLVSGDFETHFFLAKNGSVSMRGSVSFSCYEQAKEKQLIAATWQSQAVPNRHPHDDHKEFYRQSVAQLRELLRELPVQKIYIFAQPHDAFGLFSLLSEQEKGLIENILFGEYIRMHPLGLTQALSEPA